MIPFMAMNRLTLLFLILLFAGTTVELWLARRHVRHVANRRRTVPTPFRGKIPLKAHRKAADYTLTRTRFGMVEAFYGTVLLLLWTVGGGLNLLDTAWR